MPTVIWNGHLFEDIAIFQAMLDETMAYLHYDVQSLDCQSIMPQVTTRTTARERKGVDENMKVLVQVSGTVRLERARTGPLRGFSETFVLVPNAHDQASGRAAAGKRQWLVQTQNFRFVV